MASSLHDPQVAHSLWLQRRSSRRRAREAGWRSDWTPVGLLLLLLGLLVLLAVYLPANDAIEKVREAAKEEPTGSQVTSQVGALTER